MSYGYFDRQAREYVVTDPKTPTPWINYLGGGNYGGIISQTGGGYSFDGDPRYKRVLRYRYNGIPLDQPGRYIYIRDREDGDYWGATWQPVQKEMTEYRCRHGLGYTRIESARRNIKTELTYFVPGNESFEIWHLKVKNMDVRERMLTLFSYAEFSFFDAVKDQQNVDWCQQIQQGVFRNNTIFWNAFMKTWDYIFMTANLVANSFETSREKFIGKYRDLGHPIAVEQGHCDNYEASRGNGVGVLSHEITLAPGEEKEIVYILGTTPDQKAVSEKISPYLNPNRVQEELKGLQQYWDGYLQTCQVQTPDEEMNLMLNTWNPYQCKTTFNWSRFISLYQLGINRGMGFRDSAQDILGVLHAIPDESLKLIVKLLKCQHTDGHAYHLFYPLTGKGSIGEAGEDGSVDWYSDDHLWIILAVIGYIKETGDLQFLTHPISYADAQGEGRVLEHLCRAIEFTQRHLGDHGLPLAGFADWNDTINLDRGKGTAESVWTGMLYAYALKEMIQLMEKTKDERLACKFGNYYDQQKEAINKFAWDGSWYLRAFDDDGYPLGSKECSEGQLFLNPQSWAIISQVAENEKWEPLLNLVHKHLNTKYGVVLVHPAYKKHDKTKGGITTYPPGAKENGGIFLHTNPWLIIAQTMVKNGDQAYQYYRQVLPPTHNEEADRYEVEPYVYCQNILGKEHPQFGLGRNSWLTGTSAWMYRSAVYYLLGIRPDYDGLIIDPAVPDEWKTFRVQRYFRGRWLEITCIRAEEEKLVVNDEEIGSQNKVPIELLTAKKNQITFYYR